MSAIPVASNILLRILLSKLTKSFAISLNHTYEMKFVYILIFAFLDVI